jgi:hypothetical protein
MSRTIVVSDLHLGSRREEPLAARREVRRLLLERLDRGDRLVLLGDFLELREAPHRDAPALAAEFLAEASGALGPGGEILMLGGNHDHGLVAGWAEARLETEAPGFMALEHRIDPGEAGPLPRALAELAAPTPLTLAYPGVFLRPDVYALHGHYLDLHNTVPTFERLVAGAMARFVVGLPAEGVTPDAYEAALAPLYAWLHQLTQRAEHGVTARTGGQSARAWVMLAGEGRRRHPLRAAALGVAYAGAVALVNRAGLGPVQRSLSGTALRRGGLHGMREVLHRLGVEAPHVLFGHTHRSGPWPRDDLAEWRTHAGGTMVNTGCWVHMHHFLAGAPRDSPYLPGTLVELGEDGPPRLLRLPLPL